MRYAEEFNYWDTIVTPAKSQGEIIEMLESFGADSIMLVQGQAGGKHAWMIRFQWEGRNYRFAFVPLPQKFPGHERSFGGKRRSHNEQARYQMGRIAVNFVKAILTAAETEPGALFGFLELPARSGATVPYVASELNVEELARGAEALLPEFVIDRRE